MYLGIPRRIPGRQELWFNSSVSKVAGSNRPWTLSGFPAKSQARLGVGKGGASSPPLRHRESITGRGAQHSSRPTIPSRNVTRAKGQAGPRRANRNSIGCAELDNRIRKHAGPPNRSEGGNGARTIWVGCLHLSGATQKLHVADRITSAAPKSPVIV
jgi:hypothetical protein